MRSLIKGRGRRLGIATLAIFGAFAGVAYATNAVGRSATSVINACQLNGLGTIRIVSDAGKCNTRYETAISWNTTGPAGVPGPTGPASTVPGPQGSVGPKGDDGVVGTLDRFDVQRVPDGDMTVTDVIATGLNVRLACVHGNAIVHIGSFGASIPTSPAREIYLEGVDGTNTLTYPAPGNDISTAMFVSRGASEPFAVSEQLDNGWFVEITGTGAALSQATGACTFDYHLHVGHA